VTETIRGLLMGTPVGNDAEIALVWCAIVAFLGYRWPCGSTTATPRARSGC
jgi:ABC-2 type transport system permease protein